MKPHVLKQLFEKDALEGRGAGAFKSKQHMLQLYR